MKMKDLREKINQINWTDRRLITIVVIVILVLLMMDFNNRMSTMLQLSSQEKYLQTRIADLEATKMNLQAQISYATSDLALEEWAREKNRLINEGDYPIVLLPAESITTVEVEETPLKFEVLSRLEIWKELLFGED